MNSLKRAGVGILLIGGVLAIIALVGFILLLFSFTVQHFRFAIVLSLLSILVVAGITLTLVNRLFAQKSDAQDHILDEEES